MKRMLFFNMLWVWSIYAADFNVSYRTEPNQISGQYMHNIYIVALQDNLQIKDVIVNRGNCRNSFGLLNASSAPRTTYPSIGTKVDVEDVEYLNKYKPELCEALKSHKDEKVQQFKQEHSVKAEDIKKYIKEKEIGKWIDDKDVEKLTQYYFDFIQKAQKEIVDIFAKEQEEAVAPHIVMKALTLSMGSCYLQRPNDIPKVLQILEKETTDICQDDSTCSYYVREDGYNSLGEDVIKKFTKCEEAARMILEEIRDCETTIYNLIGKNHRIEMVEKWKKMGVKFKAVYGREYPYDIWKGKRPSDIPPFRELAQEVVSVPKQPDPTYKLNYGKQVMVSVPDMSCKILQVDIISNKGKETHRF